MYRKPGSQSALSGVSSGPYTGDKRMIDAERLAPATRTKIARALRSIGEPSPIALMNGEGFFTRIRLARLAIVVSIGALIGLFTVGFDVSSSWARQPYAMGLVYLALGAVLFGATMIVVRERLLVGKDSLPPGKYLFMLDIVEVSAPNKDGGQLLIAKPLGNARDAKIESVQGKRPELVIQFADLTTERFVLPRSDKDGERAMRSLEKAQALLEELTFTKELERAFIFDLFFDLRVDHSWASVAPDGAPVSKRSAEVVRKTSWLSKALHHKNAHVPFIVIGVLFSGGVFFMRELTGDQMLFRYAGWESPEAVDRYLAEGGLQKEAANERKASMLRTRAALKEQEDADNKRRAEKAAALSAHEAAQARTPVTCKAAIRAAPSSLHPKSADILEAIIDVAAETNESVIPIFFHRKVPETPTTPSDAPNRAEMRSWLDDRERVTATTFARIFSETCPTNVVRFQYFGDELEGFHPPERGGGLVIDYELTWDTAILTPVGSPIEIRPFTVHFTSVKLVPPKERKPPPLNMHAESFELTVAPPKELVMALRPRSIFVLAGAEPTTFDRRIYGVLTARAFDRLYDEIYTLFFDGNPKVPLRGVVEPLERQPLPP